jgi:hypothetical protein
LVARVGGGLPGAGTGTPVSSSGIIGIASDSDKESIKIYNTRQKYDEWEFIAILGQQGQQGQQGQGQQGQRGQDPNSQLNQPPGGQRQNNPFQGVPFNPITGQPVGPGGPALGVGGSQPPPQSSFGFIGTPQQPQMPRK